MIDSGCKNAKFYDLHCESIGMASAQNNVRKIVRELADDIESTVLNCMAAGVPLSKFVISKPELVVDGFNAKLICEFGFKPE